MLQRKKEWLVRRYLSYKDRSSRSVTRKPWDDKEKRTYFQVGQALFGRPDPITKERKVIRGSVKQMLALNLSKSGLISFRFIPLLGKEETTFR